MLESAEDVKVEGLIKFKFGVIPKPKKAAVFPVCTTLPAPIVCVSIRQCLINNDYMSVFYLTVGRRYEDISIQTQSLQQKLGRNASCLPQTIHTICMYDML